MNDVNCDCEAAAVRGSSGVAKRGRLSEGAWADVVRAARVVREEGVALKVHGVEITCVLKQHKVTGRRATPGQQKKPTEAVASKPPPAVSGEAPPPSVSKRRERSRQRLLEFQEKKRAAAVQELVAKGCGIRQSGRTARPQAAPPACRPQARRRALPPTRGRG